MTNTRGLEIFLTIEDSIRKKWLDTFAHIISLSHLYDSVTEVLSMLPCNIGRTRSFEKLNNAYICMADHHDSSSELFASQGLCSFHHSGQILFVCLFFQTQVMKNNFI